MNKTIKTITLAVVLSFGATMANAGILVADRSTRMTSCSSETPTGKGGVFSRNGIIVFGAAAAAFFKTGIIVFGSKDTQCTEPVGDTVTKNGIIVFG